jgi:hypothetical protein
MENAGRQPRSLMVVLDLLGFLGHAQSRAIRLNFLFSPTIRVTPVMLGLLQVSL